MNKLLVFALSACLLAACSKVPSQSTSGGADSSPATARNATTIPHELRIGDNLDFSSLNPHLDSELSVNSIASMTMAYLLKSDEHNRPVPELATEVPTQANGGISKDGKTITWHLRHDAKWSDGVPFTADDVVFSTHVVLNPANNEIGRDGWNLITKMDEPDKYTVVFHLSKPYAAYFPVFFGTGGANPCILPKHILAKLPNINTAPYNSLPVGIGPFKVVKWVRGDHVELDANPLYFRGAPKLQKVIYRIVPDRNTLLTLLQTGEIDLWPFVGSGYYDRVKALPHVDVIKSPNYLYAHLDFNLSRPIFKTDLPLREALRLAVDRKTIQQKVNHGTGIVQEGVETPVSPVFNDLPLVPFTIAKANALLDADGWKRGADGVRVKNGRRLNLEFALGAGNPDYDQLVELIRSTWKQIGVTLDVKRYQSALFFAPIQSGGIMYSGKFDVVFFSWSLDPTGDLSSLFECNQFPPNGQNDIHYCNPSADALMEKVKITYDEAQRKVFVGQVERTVDRDVPTIVMYIWDGIYAHNSDLKNWHPNQTAPFDDMMNVDI